MSSESVGDYLRAQNLEQLGRDDEAIELYERAVAARFDSTGPYDRLIALYSHRALHAEVIRVAEAARANVRTHPDKRVWYEDMADAARRAAGAVPPAAPKERG
ncbi:MAG: hypothetical protein ABR575_01455 [Actinomycetota bacterium]